MKIKGKLSGALSIALGIVIISVGGFSIYNRLPSLNFDTSGFLINSAILNFSKGSYSKKVENKKQTKKTTEQQTASTTVPKETKATSSDFSESYYNTFGSHSSKTKYPVYTKQFSVGGKKYQNFYVKNNTSYPLDIGKVLNSKLGFTMKKDKSIQVLIYHTHTSESYLDRDVGYYYSDYYPRTQDNRYNVTQVGDEITKELKKAGIGVVHDKTVHDESYNGSYLRSRATVEKYIKKYPSIKVTLDIHRDSIGSDTYKVKPTFTYKGKKGAQIMIMSGYNAYSYYNFPNWNYNLRFALKIQQACESNFGGMTRPLNFGNFAYNMNINTGSLLIEVGTDSNTLEEVKYSGKLLGKALSEVLQNAV